MTGGGFKGKQRVDGRDAIHSAVAGRWAERGTDVALIERVESFPCIAEKPKHRLNRDQPPSIRTLKPRGNSWEPPACGTHLQRDPICAIQTHPRRPTLTLLMSSTDRRTSLSLWPLAFLAGLLPLVGTLTAWALSTHLQLIPACNPFWEGCVSVSRAARHDLPNYIFRAFVLPAAALQALVWLLMARWIAPLAGPGSGLRWLAPLGITAAVALVLYGAFLGTEGQIYRWLRQYGTVIYFGFTCLCLLIAGAAVQRAVRAGRLQLPRLIERSMVSLAVTLVLLGVGNAIVAAMIGGELKTRVENVTEWWGALIFVIGFFSISWMWRRERLGVGFSSAAR